MYYIMKDGTMIMLGHVMVLREPVEKNVFEIVFTGAWCLRFPIEELPSFSQALMNYMVNAQTWAQ